MQMQSVAGPWVSNKNAALIWFSSIKRGGGCSEAIQKNFFGTFCAQMILEFWVEKGWALFPKYLVNQETKNGPQVQKFDFWKIAPKVQRFLGERVRPVLEETQTLLALFCIQNSNIYLARSCSPNAGVVKSVNS